MIGAFCALLGARCGIPFPVGGVVVVPGALLGACCALRFSVGASQCPLVLLVAFGACLGSFGSLSAAMQQPLVVCTP